MNTKKTTWRFWLSLVILLVLVPLTVLVFSRFDRKYYLAGLAIIVLTTAAFFLHFESRKPQARELVILAVLCALAVASRAAFAAVPHFKPMLAIVMLTGILRAGGRFSVRGHQRLCQQLYFRPGALDPVANVCLRHRRTAGGAVCHVGHSEKGP